MNKKQIDDAYRRLLLDYADKDGLVRHVGEGWTFEAVPLELPSLELLRLGNAPKLVMARFDGEAEAFVCLLEFDHLAEEGENSFRELMRPAGERQTGGLGYNRAMQRSWSLGFSTAFAGVIGSFVGGFGPDGRPGLLLTPKLLPIYLGIIAECVEAVSDPAFAS